MRGFLTTGEREFIAGDREDIKDPDAYAYNIRYKVRQRLQEVHGELELLEENGFEDLAQEIRMEFDRTTQLEHKVDRLEERLAQVEENEDVDQEPE